MANINYSTASGATAAGSYVGTGTHTGSIANIKDGNGATFDGYVAYNYQGVFAAMTNSVTFASTIDTIVAVTCTGTWGGAIVLNATFYLDLYYSSSWNQIASMYRSAPYTQQGIYTLPFIIATSGAWSNVSQVRFRVSGTGLNFPPPGPPAMIAFYNHELEAYGPTLADSGIRFVCSGTNVSIGAEPVTATHTLRVQNDSTTLGIPFVSVTAGNATAIRIYDGTSVQSIPKI